MSLRPFLPVPGTVYRGVNGRRYKCIGVSRIFGTARLRDLSNEEVFTAIDISADRFGRIAWERRCNVRW